MMRVNVRLTVQPNVKTWYVLIYIWQYNQMSEHDSVNVHVTV
jgi:hypothetical protein